MRVAVVPIIRTGRRVIVAAVVAVVALLCVPSSVLAWTANYSGDVITIERDASQDATGSVFVWYADSSVQVSSLNAGTWDNTGGGTPFNTSLEVYFDTNDVRVDYMLGQHVTALVKCPGGDALLLRGGNVPPVYLASSDGTEYQYLVDEYGNRFLGVAVIQPNTVQTGQVATLTVDAGLAGLGGTPISGMTTIAVESTLPVSLESIAGVDSFGLSLLLGFCAVGVGAGIGNMTRRWWK